MKIAKKRVMITVAILVISAWANIAGQIDFTLAGGKYWTMISREQKMYYLKGYLDGHIHGSLDACHVAARNAAERNVAWDVGFECIRRIPKFTNKGLEYYVDQITKYYELYPKDERLRVRRILFQLSDENNHSLQHIHLLYVNNELP